MHNGHAGTAAAPQSPERRRDAFLAALVALVRQAEANGIILTCERQPLPGPPRMGHHGAVVGAYYSKAYREAMERTASLILPSSMQ